MLGKSIPGAARSSQPPKGAFRARRREAALFPADFNDAIMRPDLAKATRF